MTAKWSKLVLGKNYMNLKQLKLLNLAQMHDFYTKSYAALKRI